MLWKNTIRETREEFSQRAEELTDELRNTSDSVKYALVIVGAVAVVALVIAVTKTSGNGRGH